MKSDDSYVLYLLSNFTHQVINPLNGVVGTIDNMLDGTTPPEKFPTRLAGVKGQLHCTISLIRNLAFFAQYTADYSEIKKAKMDKICIIPQVTIESLKFYQEQARQKNIAIELQDSRQQCAIKGNPDLFRQVMMNLYDNSVKYGLKNSKVNTEYWIQKTTGTLILTISGKSIGFNDTEDIFELGIRGEEAINEISSGTGIGLHVCKLIIENVLGGSITGQHIHKTKNTIFEIRLPGAFIHD
jgi:K+-sensing histidine kinase KdpD